MNKNLKLFENHYLCERIVNVDEINFCFESNINYNVQFHQVSTKILTGINTSVLHRTLLNIFSIIIIFSIFLRKWKILIILFSKLPINRYHSEIYNFL